MVLLVTPELLVEIFGPRVLPIKRAVARIDSINEAIKYAELNTTLRLAHYLGQVGHESLAFRYSREIWGPSAAQKRYERDFSAPWPNKPPVTKAERSFYAANRLAYTLGNLRAGDGIRYMGRGDLQTTGRGNYQRLTKRLRARGIDCPDFEADPAKLEQSPWIALAGADFWVMRNLNQWADLDDLYTLTKRVNGGTNGIAHRQAIKTAALTVLMKEPVWE